MPDEKTEEKENPIQYYAVIFLVAGLVTYSWFNKIDKEQLFLEATPAILALAALLFAATLAGFGVKSLILKDERSKKTTKVVFHLASLLTVSSFALITFFSLQRFETLMGYQIHFALTIAIAVYYNFLFNKQIVLFFQERKARKERFERESDEMDRILEISLESLDLDELEDHKIELMTTLCRLETNEFKGTLLKRISEIERVAAQKKEFQEIQKRREQKERLEDEIRQIKRRKREEEQNKEERLEKIKDDLKIDENDVFIKENLSKEQIEALLEEGYKQTNEYDILEQRVITVLVKPVLSHGLTHTFLVWSAKKAIEQTKGVSKVEEHTTRDADITFKYNNKTYAVEIETGNLLRKKKQLEEKISYLNKKYRKRWFFIVSNRNLQPKYKKHGLCTQRNRVIEFLAKMLNN